MSASSDNLAAAAAVIDHATMVTLLEPLTALAVEAGAAILAVRRGALGVQEKADGSPVTQADLAADRIIASGLARLAPGVQTLSEERADQTKAPFAEMFFLIDPLDGTKEFIAGRDEFTVNIALVANGAPVMGIVGAPALGLVWRGLLGHGAERISYDSVDRSGEPIRTRALPGPGKPWIAAVSRSHGDTRTDAFIAGRPGAVRQTLGSAIKFCRVADGGVDIYPRLSPTCEWDVAAGHAVIVAAGGKVTDAQGNALRYGTGRKGFILPDFIAWGDPSATL